MNEISDKKGNVTTKEAIIAVLKAVIISVLLSTAGFIIGAIEGYMFIWMGAASFPFWIAVFIVYGTVTIITGVPGIYANIYLTRKIPLPYRVAAIIFYIVIFTPIARELFFWWFWHGSR